MTATPPAPDPKPPTRPPPGREPDDAIEWEKLTAGLWDRED